MNQQVVADTNAGLSAAELAGLRENLNEQRVFRLEQLAQVWQGAPARAQRAREQAAVSQLEVHIKLCASARMVLADVEAALERMDQGTYGVCRQCRNPVELARLRIVPQARYCGRCPRSGRSARDRCCSPPAMADLPTLTRDRHRLGQRSHSRLAGRPPRHPRRAPSPARPPSPTTPSSAAPSSIARAPCFQSAGETASLHLRLRVAQWKGAGLRHDSSFRGSARRASMPPSHAAT
ncbi:TraR/DksA C4-type zinc finger protein [Streptomyces sp. TRM70350]|uniref:TraR/DksA family transcriptional regulator n=1 Tax=Streptomyces sp. TRM70350 TaxID=2856165 RepID=UPI0027DED389|nr:TraR/DksA C4-type zinc finger protein [Streptomyces sp. TRM70350]